MAEKLTPAQKIAVENRGGKLLVSAAAGSGKTKVLVDRLIAYMTDPVVPANIDDFLIITYTKAAAAELRAKIADKLTQYIALHPENRHIQQQIQRLYLAKISTVHSFCADILREYAYQLDISADFRIAEENECVEMMMQALEKLLDDAYITRMDRESFRSFIDSQGLGRDDRQIPEIILQIHASAQCHLNPDQWLDWCQEIASVENVQDVSETLWGNYLIQDLKTYLSQQIASLRNCIDKANLVPGLEKPVALLTATVADLISLQSCNTWDAIIDHPPVAYGTLTFKKEHKGSMLSEQIKAIRSACKEGLNKKRKAFNDHSSVILQQMEQNNLACCELISLVKDFRSLYDKIKRTRHILDFSDIEQRMLDLLLGVQRSGITSAAKEISLRFREILVDEYQDSNEVQDAIFSALTQKEQNCFMVGDVKQSIYQFRLADPDIFLHKYNTYIPADDAIPGQGRKVMLNSNFRSSGGIISAVNDVFATCMSEKVGGLTYGSDEMLYEGIPHIPLSEPEVELYCVDVKEDTYEEEARFTASRIQKLLDGKHMIRKDDLLRPIIADDIVILLRSPGTVGGEFRYALEQAGIPCTMGNDLDLFLAPEIDLIRSLLQTIHNPLQDIPLVATLSSPIFAFTADDLALIRSDQKHGPFYHALQSSAHPKARQFLDTLNQLRKASRFLSAAQLIHKCFALTQMLSIYGAMEDGDQRIRNLHSFCQIASDYETTGRKDLVYLLEYLDSLEEKGLPVSVGSASGAVRIMSIHKSKGLEFPVVFLCGLSRMFNTTDSHKAVLCHKELGLGLACVNQAQRVRFPSVAKRAIAARITADSISEELRVLYVAMTRARDRLIMTYAAGNLEDKVKDIAYRMDLSDRELLASDVHCSGSWILQTALHHSEAGELFHLAAYPDATQIHNAPWLIRVVTAPEYSEPKIEDSPEQKTIDSEVLEKIRRGLAFSYPYAQAAQTPSKLTATQLKGRDKDIEAAEFTDRQKECTIHFREPAVRQTHLSGTDYGNAMHAAMQYLDLSKCKSEASIQSELRRLQEVKILSPEQIALVSIRQIMQLLDSVIGKRILASKHILREFKFSILEDAENLPSQDAGDKILLQGVIDCAIIDDDGITIIDFKTDRVTPSTINERAQHYRSQVEIYARALSKIYEKPIKSAFLYFFSVGKSYQMI